uniref:NADH:ubiquinone reductase (H(+)-translocating) n=1 Tax=Suberites domuncula TaxID=55567 RepID=B1GT58_SUBDO|nr:NADH dehydrogenase subunit 2 [Suberites domuncula]CAM84218.1 NADH dehydrogenase subunit 2 [Suberites domuncula]
MITIFSEVLLSLVILSLVLYGINLSTFKISVGALFIIGVILAQLWADVLYMSDSLMWGTGGLLLTNSWIVISKLIIIMGSVALLLMYGSGTQDIKSEAEDSKAITLNLDLLKIWGKDQNQGAQGNEFIKPTIIFSRGAETESITRQWISLMLIVVLSSLLLVSSVNWLSIYLAIELQTLTLFILVAIKRESAYSTEGGLKYFVLGAVSSGLFLFGCALLYGLSGQTGVQGLNSCLTADVGKILITVSLLFKLSVAPFHMWAPDVYDGSATIIAATLATVSKIGIFSVLVQIGPVINVVLICAILSIICGSIGALNQTKIKRLLAYSGIGHMGFVLFGVAIGSLESIQASLIYMIVYVVMTICSFSIILSLKLTKILIVEVSGASRENSVLALTLALSFLSIAGIPPLAGFLSKWLILLAGVSSGYYSICILIVLSSVIAGVYYVRLVQIIYFPLGSRDYSMLVWQKVLKKEKRIDFSKSIIIGVTFFIILFLIVSPNFLLELTHDATISLYA